MNSAQDFCKSLTQDISQGRDTIKMQSHGALAALMDVGDHCMAQ